MLCFCRKAEQPGKVDVKKKTDKEVELVDGSDENGVDTDDDVIELPEGMCTVNSPLLRWLVENVKMPLSVMPVHCCGTTRA